MIRYPRKVFVNRYIFILLISIALVYVENIFSLYQQLIFNISIHADIGKSIFYLLLENSYAFILVLGFLLIISFSQKLIKVVITILLCLSSIVIYYTYKYNIIVDEYLIGNVIEASHEEVHDLFSFTPIYVLIIFGIIPSWIIIKFIKFKPIITSYRQLVKPEFWLIKIKPMLLFGVAPILVLLTIIYIFDKDIILDGSSAKVKLSRYVPVNYVSGIAQFLPLIRYFMSNTDITTIKIDKKFPFKFNNKLSNKALTIVLVIGESARLQSQHYDGYYRDTNQYTENIKNIVYFKDMSACGTFTRWSVPCMLGYKTHAMFKASNTLHNLPDTNLISVFGNLGFKTWWVSGQSPFDNRHNAVYESAKNAQTTYFRTNLKQFTKPGEEIYDGLILNYIDQILKNKAQHKLIVVHLAGSHIPYFLHYPKKFQKYKPNCNYRSCSSQSETNDYDNSLLYTDYVLSELIKRLSNLNSFLLYASDHGESLTSDNNGFKVHSAPYDIAPPEQLKVAAMMWVSPFMMKLNPTKFDNIAKYSNLPISHDYIFSTMFDCLGITSKIVNPKLSLCSR